MLPLPRNLNRPAPCQGHVRLLLRAAALLFVTIATGCAAMTNPTTDGIPVRRLSPELLATPREAEKTIPLNLLRQKKPDAYLLGPGDVLGVYIEGVLGQANQPPPVRFGEREQGQGQGQSHLPPALGYPLPVREDGTLPLPLIEPLRVEGMSIIQAQNAVRKAYTAEILKPGRERIIVTLMYPRQYHVLVVRQDSAAGTGATTPVNFAGGIIGGSSEIIGPRKRGTGFSLDLPAYENDVLSALTRTGGLPGLDAKNEVLVLRGSGTTSADQAIAMQQLCPPGAGHAGDSQDFGGDSNPQVVRIPLRLLPGAPIPFKPEDVILQTGDILFIESRDTEVFYTGGLLQAGQYPVPRDYDLDVVEAIALVRGSLINGSQSSNNFTGASVNVGIGFPNPSLISVIRRTPGGRQVTIRVDLNRALRDERERILIQPKDLIILQQTPGEAFVQYFSNQLFNLNFFANILHTPDVTATTTLTATSAGLQNGVGGSVP